MAWTSVCLFLQFHPSAVRATHLFLVLIQSCLSCVQLVISGRKRVMKRSRTCNDLAGLSGSGHQRQLLGHPRSTPTLHRHTQSSLVPPTLQETCSLSGGYFFPSFASSPTLAEEPTIRTPLANLTDHLIPSAISSDFQTPQVSFRSTPVSVTAYHYIHNPGHSLGLIIILSFPPASLQYSISHTDMDPALSSEYGSSSVNVISRGVGSVRKRKSEQDLGAMVREEQTEGHDPHYEEAADWAHYIELSENNNSTVVGLGLTTEQDEEDQDDLLLDLAACGLEGPISPFSGSNSQFIYEDLQDVTPPCLTPRKPACNVSITCRGCQP